MYGLLIESIVEYIKTEYGEDTWNIVKHKCGLQNISFVTHNIYGEELIPNIAKITAQVTATPLEEIMDGFGVAFVRFVGHYGFDRILKVLGRHMRDFLNGLDNLHEYLRFSYPKLKPPSFFCESENKNGLTLHYRTRRKGFLHYVKGQIREVGRLFYNTKIDIYAISEEIVNDTVHVVFRLLFDNKAFRESKLMCFDSIVNDIPLNSDSLFELFPFHIVFSRYMEIRNIGGGLAAVMPSLIGGKLNNIFNMSRPLVDFSWDGIMAHTNNVFEIYSKKSLKTYKVVSEEGTISISTESTEEELIDSSVPTETGNFLHLKGQMVYILEWDSIMFLATPVMNSLDDMFRAGLFINDLSMHDSSRDLVLAGTQQSAELKLALDQEQEKSRLLEQSMQMLDVEMKRTDALLYQMIPKTVADRLRKGEPSVNTCEVFDNVTILFSDVVGFTTICSKITPMEVVSMLNAMYTNFDKLSETHKVYKVETIGDAYMGVSGAPIKTKYHALSVCNMALDMVDSMKGLKDPSTGQSMQIRIGIHSGTAVAGVVGIKMPRYCLFGDAVNTTSRMETSGEAMKIHISEVTKNEIATYPYIFEERGTIELKGKGVMKTYWLLSRNMDGIDDNPPQCPFAAAFNDMIQVESPELLSEEDRAPSRTAYSPVSFEDISRQNKPSPKHLPVPSFGQSKHSANSTTHSSNHRTLGVLGDRDDNDVSGYDTASSNSVNPSLAPTNRAPAYNPAQNGVPVIAKRDSITIKVPTNYTLSPIKQNNFNNNDKILISEPITRTQHIATSPESPSTEIIEIKNSTGRPSRTGKSGVKKEGLEKPKSQTCTVL